MTLYVDFVTTSSKKLRDLYNGTPEQREEVLRAATLASTVIDIECGQSFNHEVAKTYMVDGQNANSLRLPKRLISVTGIKLNDSPLSSGPFRVVNDGWLLVVPTYFNLATTKTYDYWGTEVYQSDGPIVAPGRRAYTISPYNTLAVTGDWGYDPTPGPIVQAAELLTEDFLCGDFQYRNKHVKVVRTADWNLEFYEAGGTGNMIVDRLLADFAISNMVAI